MKNKLFISTFTIFLFNFTIFAANSIEKEENLKNGVIRYAIYVGANDGGKERERLLYAGTDAQAGRPDGKRAGKGSRAGQAGG